MIHDILRLFVDHPRVMLIVWYNVRKLERRCKLSLSMIHLWLWTFRDHRKGLPPVAQRVHYRLLPSSPFTNDIFPITFTSIPPSFPIYWILKVNEGNVVSIQNIVMLRSGGQTRCTVSLLANLMAD